ncbi:Hypothetical protein SMAX5B_000245 [Scophthalmus maximus]|uniref:Uncharacterized protein n=1 Tax=Scophthalmus maximus TaxID=52904 RepID=A0A2U9CJS9_SCOMX|nr:Hypothetical protein SMAX5B_000245 [Scophthalmus maximus]
MEEFHQGRRGAVAHPRTQRRSGPVRSVCRGVLGQSEGDAEQSASQSAAHLNLLPFPVLR